MNRQFFPLVAVLFVSISSAAANTLTIINNSGHTADEIVLFLGRSKFDLPREEIATRGLDQGLIARAEINADSIYLAKVVVDNQTFMAKQVIYLPATLSINADDTVTVAQNEIARALAKDDTFLNRVTESVNKAAGSLVSGFKRAQRSSETEADIARAQAHKVKKASETQAQDLQEKTAYAKDVLVFYAKKAGDAVASGVTTAKHAMAQTLEDGRHIVEKSKEEIRHGSLETAEQIRHKTKKAAIKVHEDIEHATRDTK